MRVPLLAIAFLLAAAAPASALDVTKTADTADGACNADCSLREAIIEANTTAGADTINVPAGTYTLTLGPATNEDLAADGDLDVRGATTIVGASSATTIVSAGGDSGIGERVFDVQPQGGAPATVSISDLQITGGRGFDNGGGVRSSANLTLDEVLVTGNELSTGGFGHGGGVAREATDSVLTITDSTISLNEAPLGAGVGDAAPAPASGEGLVIERTTIDSNATQPTGEGDPDGGGVAILSNDDVRITHSAITRNVVNGDAGSGDDASGAGIYASNASDVALYNATISDNVVNDGGYGAGIANIDSTVSLTNVTLANNDVTPVVTIFAVDPGNPALAGGNIDALGGTTSFKNTIVDDAAPQNCRGRFTATFTSAGHNTEWSTTDAGDTCGFDQPTDQEGTDPQLGPLQNNGGPTETRALPAGSPAVNSADNVPCASDDQRGFPRPQPVGGVCDRGAYEREAHDLSIEKTASDTSVTAGDEVDLTLAVENAGPANAPAVTVTDALPAGMTFVSATPSQGSCSGTTTVTCSLGAIASGGSASVVIRVTVAEGAHDNTATVAGDGTFEESNSANNSSSARVEAARPQHDLSIAKTASAPEVTVGGEVTFTLEIDNAGPDDAPSVTVTDTLPAGLTFVSATPSQGSCSGTTTITCSLGAIASGGSASIEIRATVAEGEHINPASVAGAASHDEIDPDNNESSATVRGVRPQHDLSIHKTASDSKVKVGAEVTFTLTVANAGPAGASSVTVTDTLPSGLTFVSATPSQGSCSGTTTVTCSLGPIAAGGSATVALRVKVSEGEHTNTATVAGAASHDEVDSANNTARATVVGERPRHDLSIQKLVSAARVPVGQEVRFTLAITNGGPDDAPSVQVTDALPSGLTFVSAEPSQGSCSGTANLTCSLGPVAAGQAVDVVVRARVAEGEHTNTASVAGASSVDEVNTANNTASVRVVGELPPVEPCVDRVAPITELKRSNVVVRNHKVHLSGTTYDPDPCASGVNRVLVSLARVRGRHLINCRFIRSKTRYLLTPAPGMNCQDPVLFKAKGGSSTGTTKVSYSFIYFVHLPDGIYRAQARAFDNAGNKEKPTKGRNIRKFFVR